MADWEHLDPETDRITAVQDPRDEWTHANGLAELPNGNIVVEFSPYFDGDHHRPQDRKNYLETWSASFVRPACADAAANGNLLLFDNGPHRLDHTMPFSRVIEVELATKQIVWKYQERREYEFFSPRMSNAQRLPNGNTLICEGDFGRLFEVTPQGELVWEYVNPYFNEGQTG